MEPIGLESTEATSAVSAACASIMPRPYKLSSPAPPVSSAVAEIRLITWWAGIDGFSARISAAIPETRGAAPEVPDQWAYSSPGNATTSGSAGAATPMVMPSVEASHDAVPSSSSPATVRTPGMVAGAPTTLDPDARLPAATTTTTSFSSACKKALTQDSGQSWAEEAREILMTSTPWSTSQTTPSAIC